MSTTQVTWTWEENKAFEKGIALYLSKESDEEWKLIAALVPNKTVEQVKHHYKILVEDLHAIETGDVQLPQYVEADTKSIDSSITKK